MADKAMTWESFQKEQKDRLDEICPSARTIIFCSKQNNEFLRAFATFLQSERIRHLKDIQKLDCDLEGMRMLAERRGITLPDLDNDIWVEVDE